ncbi:hypothetical protein KKB71_02460, partial [Patescibacteria group bacterium]|nr:hypothetical protein [Patescibacteria group bacterium]
MQIIKQFYLPMRQTFITIIICLVILTGVNLVHSWTGPPGNPPDSNASAPINVSTTAQTFDGSKILKVGSLGNGSLGINGALTVNGLGIFNSNVGIGTAGPTAKLEVNLANPSGWSGNLKALRMLSPDNGYYLDVNTYVVATGNVGYHFSPNTNTGLVITTPGNVGIGTTNPGTKLDVNGNISLRSRIFPGALGTESGYSLVHFKGGTDTAGGIVRASKGTDDLANAPLRFEASSFTFGGNVNVGGNVSANQFCLPGANPTGGCISAWPTGGGYWTLSGANIYNTNTGNVGIGTAG